MGKITKTKVITDKINVHIFYCDSCQKKIAECEESYYDGYYEEPYIELSLNIFDEIYSITLCLCEDCKAKFKNKLIKSLMNLGFEVKK